MNQVRMYRRNHNFHKFPFSFQVYCEHVYSRIYILDSVRVPSCFELLQAGFHTLRKFRKSADGLAKSANYRRLCSRDYDNLYHLANPAWES